MWPAIQKARKQTKGSKFSIFVYPISPLPFVSFVLFNFFLPPGMQRTPNQGRRIFFTIRLFKNTYSFILFLYIHACMLLHAPIFQFVGFFS